MSLENVPSEVLNGSKETNGSAEINGSAELNGSRRKFRKLSEDSEILEARRDARALDTSLATAADDEEEEEEDDAEEDKDKDEDKEELPDRTELEKVWVWYASYGSNMWEERFKKYLNGGKVEGMTNDQLGCIRKNVPPRDSAWKQFHHRMFFARKSTTWKRERDGNPGGVAFLDPTRDLDLQLLDPRRETDERKGQGAWLRIYLIALDQFNDVVLQESREKPGAVLVGLEELEKLKNGESANNSLQVLKDGYYPMVKYLGSRRSEKVKTEEEFPILTFTCSYSQFDKIYNSETTSYKLNRPSDAYVDAIRNGLKQNPDLKDDDDAIDSYLEYCKNGKLKG